MSIFYMDYENGNDSTTATPLGWWSVLVKSATGTVPAADETMTGATSFATAKLTILDPTWPGGPIQYPLLFSDTYVKATSSSTGTYAAFNATNPALSLTGTWDATSWLGNTTNQRFHFDLGVARVISKITYNNNHYIGSSTNVGVKNFTFWGSNDATAFATLTYGTDTNWTQLTCDASQFLQHASSDVIESHDIAVTNTTAYRYYAFKFADNWGHGTYMGVRRIYLTDAYPTLYFYGKSGTFQSETVNFSGGSSGTIEADLTYCAWKTVTSGATAVRTAPGDTIRIAKSGGVTSLGSCQWTGVSRVGGGFPAPTATALSAPYSTYASPIVATSSTLAASINNGDVVYVHSHSGNTAANGAWVVSNKSGNNFTLTDSVGNGIPGADGYVQSATSKAVVLPSVQTMDISRCEDIGQMITNSTFTSNANGWTLGGGGGTPDWRYTSNYVDHANLGGTNALQPSTPLPIVANTPYYVTFTLSSVTGGSVTASVGATNGTARSTSATFSEVIVAGDTTNLKFTPSNDFAGRIDTITMSTGAWFADNSSTVTFTGYTSAKEGSAAVKITKASYGTNTLYAHCPLASLNLSGYQKITFWLYNSAAIADATTWVITLCSDTAGTTAVDTFIIPAITTTGWIPLTLARVGTGSLGGNIKAISVSTGATAPTGNSYIFLDNIMATTTNGLNLQSLISKSSTEYIDPPYTNTTEGWYAIQSINGKVIMLDGCDPGTCTPTHAYNRGYYDIGDPMTSTPHSATTYYRETIKTTLATSSTAQVQTVQESGVAGSYIQYQGGFNTATNIQDGETVFDGLTAAGYGLYLSSKSYVTVNRLSLYRYYIGLSLSAVSSLNLTCGNLSHTAFYGLYANGLSSSIVNVGNANFNVQYGIGPAGLPTNNTYTIGSANCNYTGGLVVNGDTYSTISVNFVCNNGIGGQGGLQLYNAKSITVAPAVTDTSCNTGAGLYVNQGGIDHLIMAGTSKNNSTYGFAVGQVPYDGIRVCNMYASGNTTASVQVTSSTSSSMGSMYLYNCFLGDSAEFSTVSLALSSNFHLYSQRHDQTVDNHYILFDGGNIITDTTTRHTASGICWKISPTSTTRNIYYPMRLSVGKVAVTAGTLVTVGVWVNKTHATDIAAQLFIQGGQVPGVLSNLATVASDDTGYQHLTKTFTPSEAGVVGIEVWVWWVANTADESVYVDDFTATQV